MFYSGYATKGLELGHLMYHKAHVRHVRRMRNET